MGEPLKHAKWNKLVKKERGIIWFHLYEAPRVAKFLETESRIAATKGWVRG